MTTICIPPLEDEPWPTLGPQVCACIEAYLVFGPGDLRGQPAKLNLEQKSWIYRAYEVYPEDAGMLAGVRRFDEVDISVRKGLAKTEFAAWIAAVELHPEGPVRCDGWRTVTRGGVKMREPVGRGVTDPYVPMVAYTEEQTEELAYAALKAILEKSQWADDFDIGLERIIRVDGSGRAVALAAAPDARDGARTTFQHLDETHRWTLPRLKDAAKVMKANLSKRRIAQPWQLSTTTTYSVGENSVAEDRMKYAQELVKDDKRAASARLFFFHRQASEDSDLTTPEGLRAALVEATGGDEYWHNIDGIQRSFDDPTADLEYLYRVWLNMPRAGGGKYFPLSRWREMGPVAEATDHRRKGYMPADGALIVAGFDGARFHDATALVGMELETGFQWPLGIWAPPPVQPQTADDWEVDKAIVSATVEAMFERWTVVRMYCDPPEWTSEIAHWQGTYGDKVVIEWWTRRLLAMAYALKAYRDGILDGTVCNDGDPMMAAHIGNAVRQHTNLRTDKGETLYVVRKERSDSALKIDAAVAGCLANEARNDAIAAGALVVQTSVYDDPESEGIEWI